MILDPPSPTLFAPLRIRNFRNLWLGHGISLIGDQFKFVSLSWLVLSLTGRSAALGTVLMLQAIPRSILMLAGGVVTDRFHPRSVMLLSDLFRAFVVGTIAVLAWTQRITMPHVYALALLFGTVHAFFFPAQSAMIPELVPPGALRQANAIHQLTTQVVIAGAPALAGGVIGGTRAVGRRGLTGNAIIIVMGILLGLVSMAPTLGTAAGLLFLSGALMSWLGITFMTLLQLRTDRAYMGRVMAIMLFGIYGLYPFSYGLAGWVSEAIGVRALFVAGGVMIVAASMLGLASRAMRRLD